MFIGGEQTGWRSAVIYTFVEQVRRHGADPFAYFEWVSAECFGDFDLFSPVWHMIGRLKHGVGDWEPEITYKSNG